MKEDHRLVKMWCYYKMFRASVQSNGSHFMKLVIPTCFNVIQTKNIDWWKYGFAMLCQSVGTFDWYTSDMLLPHELVPI